ncbi:hypothetical protein KMW28_21785 [Flammeovirga yaeyamensis]|uniref:Lipoprotein n=1 Tax=Flammeovirga yaeyamensis TaxID=367791 RepID=A0AAX1NF48_9BACT|nr:hypothetical protein [Flammeovirga yaeyamensis]MBB3697013.1 hypothetical protein [Flammeovirga yaeyamensis]NMF33676.1 hypothetical protein [Flammeovirga yaeyamensis]QWG05058.1 hypothetical protein KMW28_21785 [Flammeovirga yaeyamensis]
MKLLLLNLLLLFFFSNCDQKDISNRESKSAIQLIKVFSKKDNAMSYQYNLYKDSTFTKEFYTNKIDKNDQVISATYQLYSGTYTTEANTIIFHSTSLYYETYQVFASDTSPSLISGSFDVNNKFQEKYLDQAYYHQEVNLDLHSKFKLLQEFTSYKKLLASNELQNQ